MTIGGISGNANGGAGSSPISLNTGDDAYSKSLQNQIADAQKQLQELSQNNEMDPETKMKRRQELQKQISDLNMQLRQHQMEMRRKAQQEKQENQSNNAPQKPEENTAGMSSKSVEAIISAESSLKQAKIQGSTADRLENDAEIKRAEIKRDGGGEKRSIYDGNAISRKWDDVEKLERNADSARVSLSSSLAEAEDEISKANDGGSAKADEEGKVGVNAEDSEKNNDVSDEEQNAEQAKAAMSKTAEIGSNMDVRV